MMKNLLKAKTVKIAHFASALLVAFCISSCSSAPLSLPTEVKRYETLIEVKAKAKIVVKATASSCEAVRDGARFEAVIKKGNPFALKTACDGTKFSAVSDTLNAGLYTLRLSLRKHSLKELHPLVTLELSNPDYRSGPDQYLEGAVAIEPDKAFEGKVHYLEGDTNDWLRVAGEKKRVFLTFIPQEDTRAVASVYRVPAGGRATKLQNLTPGKPTALYLGKDDLVVRVTAHNEDAETTYSILRRDEEAKKMVSLQVVDAYPVGPNASIVLLRPNAQVKADDELRISAKNESGKWKDLGACRVSNVSEEGIQCEMGGAWNERFVEYRATGTTPASG